MEKLFAVSFLFLAACASENAKIKAEYEQCLAKINSFTEEQLFNRFVRRPLKIVDYGDGRKYLVSKKCEAQRAGKLKERVNHCAIYERFEQAEVDCLKGASMKCNEGMALAGRIQSNPFHLQKKACELGNQYWCYYISIREAFTNATKTSLQKSCKHGKDDACLYLGIIIWNSDRKKATALFEGLGSKGNTEVIGVLERLGAIDEQMVWLQKACEKGYQGFCFSLNQRDRSMRMADLVRNGCFLSAYSDE